MSTGLLIIFLLTLLITWHPSRISSDRAGSAKLNINWIYRNPRRRIESGADWFHLLGSKVEFDFCLRRSDRSQSCDVALEIKKGYKNEKSIQDSTGVTVSLPIPEEVILTVDISVRLLSLATLKVASFVSTPFALIADRQMHELSMKRVGSSSKNNDVSLSVRLETICDEFFHGERCERYCKPLPLVYECSPDGERICAAGFFGDLCDQRDACYFEPCAEHAVCQRRPNGSGRICLCNGHEGPECYPNYNPCSLKPCKNGGVCQPSGQYNETFTCVCTGIWEGVTCTERRSACIETADQMKQIIDLMEPSAGLSAQLSVCQNGGKCFEDPDRFAFYCVCPDEWTGEKCEVPNTRTKSVKYLLLIAGLPSITFLLLCCVALVAVFVWCHHQKKNPLYKPVTMDKNRHFTRCLPMKHSESNQPVELLQSFITDRRSSTLGCLPPLPEPIIQIRTFDRESTVYDECIPDDQYLDMSPFNPVYQDDRKFLESDSVQRELSQAAAPMRPDCCNLKCPANEMTEQEMSRGIVNISHTASTSDSSSDRKSQRSRPHSIAT